MSRPSEALIYPLTTTMRTALNVLLSAASTLALIAVGTILVALWVGFQGPCRDFRWSPRTDPAAEIGADGSYPVAIDCFWNEPVFIYIVSAMILFALGATTALINRRWPVLASILAAVGVAILFGPVSQYLFIPVGPWDDQIDLHLQLIIVLLALPPAAAGGWVVRVRRRASVVAAEVKS